MNEFPHNTVLKGKIPPENYLDLLDKYLSICPYILPRDRDNGLNRPSLRHPGNHPGNYLLTFS